MCIHFTCLYAHTTQQNTIQYNTIAMPCNAKHIHMPCITIKTNTRWFIKYTLYFIKNTGTTFEISDISVAARVCSLFPDKVPGAQGEWE